MIRHIALTAFFVLSGLLCSQVQASHIQYVDLGNVTDLEIGAGDTWTGVFDLTRDLMYLWEITSPTSTPGGGTPDVSTAESIGSYDPAYALHYVTLRIDPNNTKGSPTSGYVELLINGIPVPSWQNPISIYGWGVPGGSLISDPYGIVASNYIITLTLNGLSTLGTGSISVTNVNLEGCYDTATAVPEPASLILLGTGLLGLAGVRRKIQG